MLVVGFFLQTWLIQGVAAQTATKADVGWSAGFFAQDFDLTLQPGHRFEAGGPFYYQERNEDELTVAVPPLISFYNNLAVHSAEMDLLYPLFSYEHYTDEWRVHLFELLSFAGGQQQDDFATKRFTLYPLYFQQRSQNTNLNYTAFFPFYGRTKNRLMRDETFCVMFPCYSETRKKDVVTDNYLYPFVHVRHGDQLSGWQVWPFIGQEQKALTTETNGFGDVTVIGGHDKSFVLWPLWLDEDTGLGTENPTAFRAAIPFYAQTRSPLYDCTTVLWPFFTVFEDRAKKYRQWEMPWPFIIFARGEGKTTDRVWPLFSQSHNATMESDSYVWPIYTHKHTHSEPLDWDSTRIFFYLYVGVTERNTETGGFKRRCDMWPFFTWRKDFNGNTRLQVLAPLESILSNSRGIDRNWSPLWAVWRAEDNPRADRHSRSCLWNLYRRDTVPGEETVSCAFGLYQHRVVAGKKSTRLFYIPLSKP